MITTKKASEVEIGDRIVTTSGAHEVIRIVPIAIGQWPGRQIFYVNRTTESVWTNQTEQVDHATVSVEVT